MREARFDASDGLMGIAGKCDANWGREEEKLMVYYLCSRESR